ncbi:hypothetical protein PIB30_025699 [Stylosanthes scabra]|uniref:Acid phosphatase 1 n=1 Tax=Stylosanthes scabra TaxID=79078 RepID=A0ABU6XB24_9FABA|nr:hypothetical protein [Stylosanthes scabra]
MRKSLGHCLVFMCLLIPLAVADWNILNQKLKSGLKISLKNYCEAWRMNVELHNIRGFEVKDGKDAWIFDIDDTLLSTVPYYKDNLYGGKKLNLTSLEEWMSKSKAKALDHSLKLFNSLKSRGIQIILVSARREHLRSATTDNLVNVGYYGWTSLIMRGPDNELVSVGKYKSDVRQQLVSNGYRIWGILGDQYSSIQGPPSGIRTFKLPNPMYYVA